MFRDGIRLRGGVGELLWGGYRIAAQVAGWTIQRYADKPGQPPIWMLTGAVQRVDTYASKQRPLFFTARREKGHWMWPVRDIHQLGPNQLRVVLGQPEQ